MSKLGELLRNDHIRAASVSGSSIIILAVFFKKIMHTEVPKLEAAVPALVYTLYEVIKNKTTNRFWSQLWPWNVLMLLSTGLIMLKYLIWP